MITQKTVCNWQCDCCGKQVQSPIKPNTESDPWGKLMVEQDAGFDGNGCPWAPRMREPMLLCGSCIETALGALNRRRSMANEVRVFKDSDSWCAVGPEFVNLQQSHAAFGDTPEKAKTNLLNDLEAPSQLIQQKEAQS